MSVKGQITTAEPLEFKDFIRLLSSLHEDGNYLWELYCCISFCTACRVSDVLSMTWKDVLEKRCTLQKSNRKPARRARFRSTKTYSGESRRYINCSAHRINGCRSSATLKQKKPYTSQYINDTLKYLRVKYRLPIKRFSSHTFRKTFGRYVYESMGRTTEALILLSMILKHSSPQVTMVYLGIRQEEIAGVYGTIQLNY